jgi:hypothetical protein
MLAPSGAQDFTWVWGRELLISKRMLDLFTAHGVTGFAVKPAMATYPAEANSPAPQLFELVVNGWGGLASPAAGVRLIDWCPDCRYRRCAIADPSRLIDPHAWDGSDLFFVWPLPLYRFVSDRLAQILQQSKPSGLKLVPAEHIPMEKGATASPGALNWSIPEARARELEQRLGVSQWLVKEYKWPIFRIIKQLARWRRSNNDP